MKNFKLPFKRIWLLVLGIVLAGSILGFGHAQYKKEINSLSNKPKQRSELINNEIVSDTKLEKTEEQKSTGIQEHGSTETRKHENKKTKRQLIDSSTH